MKKILLICLLSGQMLVAHAEESNGHGIYATPDDKTRHARFPHPIPPPEGEGNNERLREFHVNANSPAFQPEQNQSSEIFRSGSIPRLYSSIALIYDQKTQRPLYTKNSDALTSIASITKLMTAMVVLDAKLPLDEEISIDVADIDTIKGTRSRLRVGMTLTRSELLRLALMSSENRAAAALARTYPGGCDAAIWAMNQKAHKLGMQNTRFLDPAGLNSNNVSTAHDLVKMVLAARNYHLIHQYTTAASYSVDGWGRRELHFRNTNPLVKNASWNIGVSKTGYISEAGRCLVMEATISRRPVIIVLLDSSGKNTRIGDANRIRKWMESNNTHARLAARS